jgi:hypothetical protein
MKTEEFIVRMQSTDGKRTAELWQVFPSRQFKVVCKVEDSVHLTVDCKDKSYYWAQDVAENFITYVGSFTKNSH